MKACNHRNGALGAFATPPWNALFITVRQLSPFSCMAHEPPAAIFLRGRPKICRKILTFGLTTCIGCTYKVFKAIEKNDGAAYFREGTEVSLSLNPAAIMSY